MLNKLKLSIVLCLMLQSAWAGKDIDQDDAKALRQQGVILPLEQILQTAQRLHPGRVIEVELEKKRGRYVYEVEIADNNGQVWELKIDAGDATLLSKELND
ncbi:MAG TPA: PepSY domain-containing protein [Gammaproteobacteria bacterium]